MSMPLKKSKLEDTAEEIRGSWRLTQAEKRIQELELQNRNLKQYVGELQNNVQELKSSLIKVRDDANAMYTRGRLECENLQSKLNSGGDPAILACICRDELETMAKSADFLKKENTYNFPEMANYTHTKFLEEVGRNCQTTMQFLNCLFGISSSSSSSSSESSSKHFLAMAVASCIHSVFKDFSWEFASALMYSVHTLTRSSRALDMVGMSVPGACLCRTLDGRLVKFTEYMQEHFDDEIVCDLTMLHMIYDQCPGRQNLHYEVTI
jgi:hypothetical protein